MFGELRVALRRGRGRRRRPRERVRRGAVRRPKPETFSQKDRETNAARVENFSFPRERERERENLRVLASQEKTVRPKKMQSRDSPLFSRMEKERKNESEIREFL